MDTKVKDVRMNVGRIVRIVGPVIDVEFGADNMPAIYNALSVDVETPVGRVQTIAEVQQHLPGVGYRVPEGTFLAWLDFTAVGLGDDPSAVLRERAKVALHPGPGFGLGGAGHARLNFGTSPDILCEAVQRIAAAL